MTLFGIGIETWLTSAMVWVGLLYSDIPALTSRKLRELQARREEAMDRAMRAQMQRVEMIAAWRAEQDRQAMRAVLENPYTRASVLAFGDYLTTEIYHAAIRAGLDPEWEMMRMSESVVYPVAFADDTRTAHHHACECAACQMSWPEERRSRIIRGVAHAHFCRCDECRSQLSIEAQSLPDSIPMLCSSTESPWALGNIGPWSAQPELYKTTCSSLPN